MTPGGCWLRRRRVGVALWWGPPFAQGLHSTVSQSVESLRDSSGTVSALSTVSLYSRVFPPAFDLIPPLVGAP